MNRKAFINRSLLAISGLSFIPNLKASSQASSLSGVRRPMVISTWQHGMAANEMAWEVLIQGGRALEKVPDARNQPIYYIALNKEGELGGYGTNANFKYALYTEKKGNRLIQSGSAY